MLDKDLKDYLDKVKLLPKLPSEAETRQALKEAGWNDQEIEESIAYLKPATAAPVPPAPVFSLPPVQPIQPKPIQPQPVIHPAATSAVASFFPPSLPARPSVSPYLKQAVAEPITPTPIKPLTSFSSFNSIPSVEASSPSPWKTVFSAIIIAFLILGGGLGYMYYSKIWIFAPLDSEESGAFSGEEGSFDNPLPQTIATSTSESVASRPEKLIDTQIGNIIDLHTALQTYREIAGVYPDSLADLAQTAEEILKTHPPGKGKTISEYIMRMYFDEPILAVVPQDIFTRQNYIYTYSADDYKITYVINIPVYKDRMDISRYYRPNFGSQAKIILNYIAGANTATSRILSEEAITDSAVDNDKDGVPDSFEDWIGFDKTKNDTDSDRISDLEEILLK